MKIRFKKIKMDAYKTWRESERGVETFTVGIA